VRWQPPAPGAQPRALAAGCVECRRADRRRDDCCGRSPPHRFEDARLAASTTPLRHDERHWLTRLPAGRPARVPQARGAIALAIEQAPGPVLVSLPHWTATGACEDPNAQRAAPTRTSSHTASALLSAMRNQSRARRRRPAEASAVQVRHRPPRRVLRGRRRASAVEARPAARCSAGPCPEHRIGCNAREDSRLDQIRVALTQRVP
jgi:hypothetical protein